MIELELAYQAQQSVIGSMLIDERCVPLVLSKLTPDDFTDGTCRSTFTAIRKLSLEGRPVDPMTVVDAMQGGERYVGWMREAMERTPTAANVGEYIPMVRKAARRRRVLDLAEQLPEAEDDEFEALVRKMVSALSATERMPRMSGQERFADFFNRMKDPKKPDYLPWGIPTADRATYAELGDMVLLGGLASSGKTLLSIQMAQAQAKAGYKVGYYSLETSPEKMTDRQAASLAGVPLGRIKKRDVRDGDWPRLAEACSLGAGEYAFPVIDASGSTVDDITADALGHGYQIVYVDYVQQLTVAGMRTDNPRIVVAEVSQRLKRFARSTKTAVVALAQLSRPDKEDGKVLAPTMYSFKESGQLEQDADVAFLLWLSDPNDNFSNRNFKIGKNKEGARYTVELVFHGDTQTMVELEKGPDTSVATEMSNIGRAVKQRNRANGQMEFRELRGGDDDNPFDEEE